MFNIVIKDKGVTYRLKSTMYMLSRVPSKVVSKTPYKYWFLNTLKHLYVWVYLSKVRIYNPHEKNQYLRTTRGFFICYLEKSKIYKFYYHNHNTRIAEIRNARFIENHELSGSETPTI